MLTDSMSDLVSLRSKMLAGTSIWNGAARSTTSWEFLVRLIRRRYSLSEDFSYFSGVCSGQTISLPYNEVFSIPAVVSQCRNVDGAILSERLDVRDLKV